MGLCSHLSHSHPLTIPVPSAESACPCERHTGIETAALVGKMEASDRMLSLKWWTQSEKCIRESFSDHRHSDKVWRCHPHPQQEAPVLGRNHHLPVTSPGLRLSFPFWGFWMLLTAPVYSAFGFSGLLWYTFLITCGH